FHLRMEDSAVCTDRVDGEPRALGRYLKRLARDPGKFESHVDSRGCHDDVRGGFTHPIALIRDRRGWPEGRSGRGPNSRQAPVRVDPPQKAVERARPCVPSRDGSSAIWGPPEAPRGGPQNSSPSPPPSPPSPPPLGPAPPAPPDLAAITSSIRSTMTAASVADETA